MSEAEVELQELRARVDWITHRDNLANKISRFVNNTPAMSTRASRAPTFFEHFEETWQEFAEHYEGHHQDAVYRAMHEKYDDSIRLFKH